MHWEYIGFIVPLLVLVELVRELLSKRPAHLKDSNEKKQDKNANQDDS